MMRFTKCGAILCLFITETVLQDGQVGRLLDGQTTGNVWVGKQVQARQRIYSDVSERISTVSYKGKTTTITCPGQVTFTLPRWTGPPVLSDGRFTVYTLINDPSPNPDLPRVSYAADNRSLILTDTRLSDAGIYRCFIPGFVGDNIIIVRSLPNQPEITASERVDNNGIRASERRALTVTCTSRGGYPLPTVALYMGSTTGQPLVHTSTGTQVGDTFTVMLNYTFSPTRQDDRQQLVCRSYWPTPINAQGSLEETVFLYLILKPVQQNLTQTTVVAAGNDVTLQCRSSGSRPAANISWTYQGQVYTPNISVTNDTTTETITTVSVLRRPVLAADNGQTVVCRVSHMAVDNDLTAAISLNVWFPVGPFTTKITGNRVIVANGANQLSLGCTTGSSNPPADIAWRNGTAIITNNNTFTNATGINNGMIRSQTLQFIPTRYDHSITCLATNGVNQFTDEATVTLNLQYHPLITDIPARNVTEGDSVTLSCHANSEPPASFTWRKNTVVVANGRGTVLYNGLNYSIHNASKTHTGTYTCTADNQVPPSDSRQTLLTVFCNDGHTEGSLATAATDTDSTMGAIIGAAVGGFIAGAMVATVVGFVWRRRGLPLNGQRKLTKSTEKRQEVLVLEVNKNERHERTADVITSASNEIQPYDELSAAGDIQCYEQLQGNRTDGQQRVYDNTELSSYEVLQTNQQDNSHNYDQLNRNEQNKTYENLKVSAT